MTSRTPLKALLAAAAILGACTVASLAATVDDKVAQTPATQGTPAVEPATPAPDQPNATDEKATTPAKRNVEQPAASTEKPTGSTSRAARSPEKKARVAARPARVRRDYYRVAAGEIERGSRNCAVWCGRVLFLGIGW